MDLKRRVALQLVLWCFCSRSALCGNVNSHFSTHRHQRAEYGGIRPCLHLKGEEGQECKAGRMLLRLQGGGQDENGLGEGYRGDFSREVKDDTYYKRGDGRVVHKNNEYSQMIERRDLMAIEAGKLVLVMVGLPGRGKSYISRRLELFMSWLGDKVKVFNVGQYRRNVEDAKCSGKANFFDPNNAAAAEIREQAAAQAMEDMLRFLDGAGQVAIYDATNSQQKRRQWIWNSVKARNPMHQVVYVESICEDPNILQENLRSKVANSPDFVGMAPEEALADLQKRIANYETAYQSVSNNGVSYIKLFDLSSKVMVNKIYGRLATTLVPYLMSVHIGTRPIWLVRAGAQEDKTIRKRPMARCLSRMYSSPDLHSDLNDTFKDLMIDSEKAGSTRIAPGSTGARTSSHRMPAHISGREFLSAAQGRLGDHRSSGDRWSYRFGSLAKDGQTFAQALSSFVIARSAKWHAESGVSCPALQLATNVGADEHMHCPPPVHLCKAYTSTILRATETVAPLINDVKLEKGTMPLNSCPQLNPMDLGEYWEMSWDQVQEFYPEVMQQFKADPFRYRFRGGESYTDVIRRLEPILVEIEQQTCPVLVVSHGSTLKALYSYFSGIEIKDCHTQEFPLHTVIELTPVIGGSWIEQRFQLDASGYPPEQVKGPTPLTVTDRLQ